MEPVPVMTETKMTDESECTHEWQFIHDWEGDPRIPNGVKDTSRIECKLCGATIDTTDPRFFEMTDD